MSTAKAMYRVIPDDEFQEYHRQKRKQKLLDDMIAASNAKSFSTKNVRNRNKTQNSENTDSNVTPFKIVPNEEESKLHVTDDEWGELLSKSFGEDPSPIKKVTEREMTGFTLEDIGWGPEDDEQYYKNMYKKEHAMLAELLKDASGQAKIANNILNQLTKNGNSLRLSGGAGLSKLFPDLLSSANSVNATRRAIIKDMADLRKSAADFELKRMKELKESSDESQDVNATANSFYSQIIGNRKQFIDQAMANAIGPAQPSYPNQPQPNNDDNYDNDNNSTYYADEQPSDDGLETNRFNITAPLYGYDDEDDYEASADPYGYLRNENRDISICVQVYQDGNMEFVAVDENGEYVEDYELPGDDLLDTMTIRPTSSYATDAEGRRYKIIKFDGKSDLSDI